MKIALLHDSILPPKNYGGTERVVMLLARELAKRNHEVVIISRKGSRVNDFEHITLPEKFEDYVQKLPGDLDFLHSHQPLSITPKVPYLITIHGNGQPGEKFDPNTNFVSQSHAKNHNAKYFVYNGIDVNDYRFSSEKENSFSFLAKASWRVKNLKTAIVCAHDMKTPLHVMGGNGISTKYVRYHGIVGEEEKNKILPLSKALLYPTNWDEPFGLAVIEALACGTPVIASNNGAMSEIISPDVGFVCKTYDEMIKAAKNVSHIDPDRCRTYVKVKFSAEKMTSDYIYLYEKIYSEGKLDQSPKSQFSDSSVNYLFKPTFVNKLLFKIRGKI